MHQKIFYFLFLGQLLLFGSLSAKDFEKTKLAVMPFKDNTGQFDKKLNDSLFNYLESYFTDTKRFRVLSRRDIDKVIAEKELIFSGATDIENIEEVAPILATEKFVVGDIVSFSKYINSYQLDSNFKKVREGKRYNKKTQKEEDVFKNYISYKLNQSYGVELTVSGKLIDTATGEILDTIVARFKYKKTASKDLGTYEAGIITKLAMELRIANHPDIVNSSDLESLVNSGIKSCAKKIVKGIAKKVKLTGTLYAIHNGKYLISLGKKNGLFDKANLEVYKSIKVKNPSSGKVYSYRQRQAVLFVNRIHDDHCEAVYVSGNKEALQPLADVQVIEPVFVLPTMLASAVVPGLGNIVYGTGGWGYFFSELFFFGMGISTALGVWDDLWVPPNGRYLNDVIVSDTGNRNRNGMTTSSAGRVQQDIKNGVHITGWILTGIGVIIHIVNVVDASTPARVNPLLSSEGIAFNPLYKKMQHSQNRWQLSAQLIPNYRSFHSLAFNELEKTPHYLESINESNDRYYFGLAYLF